MNLKLIRLSKAYEKQLGEMIDEWKVDQEINHTNHSPWATDRCQLRDAGVSGGLRRMSHGSRARDRHAQRLHIAK